MKIYREENQMIRANKQKKNDFLCVERAILMKMEPKQSKLYQLLAKFIILFTVINNL